MGLGNSSGVPDFRNMAASFLARNRPNLALNSQKHHYLVACGGYDGSGRRRMEVGSSSQLKIGDSDFFSGNTSRLSNHMKVNRLTFGCFSPSALN